jgi:uncharacterized protein
MNTGPSATPHATAAVYAVRLIDCMRLPPEPWANGGGTTRTLARDPALHDDPLWRVSIATLDGVATFSQFIGYDRTLLPMEAGTIDLYVQDEKRSARAGQPVHFSGDLHVWARPPAQPVNVLNVMCKRGAYRAQLSVVTQAQHVAPAPTQLLVGLAGHWKVESALLRGVTLAPLNAVWITGRTEQLALIPSDPGAQLASIAIEAVTPEMEDSIR